MRETAVASGLKPYDQASVDDLVNRFNECEMFLVSALQPLQINIPIYMPSRCK